jgi:hypothetical protein
MQILTVVMCLLTLTAAHAGAQCLGDFNSDGKVTIDELVTAVDNALHGCQVLPARFVDNADGTITDHKTKLMWEKKDQAGGIHDYLNSFYTWCVLRRDGGLASCATTNMMDGPLVTTFLAAMNGEGGFAGHTDWRIPTIDELQSIANYQNANPAVDPVFNTGCVPGCTVTMCSCTNSFSYWSSTTYQQDPTYAWVAYFNDGFVDTDPKIALDYVRAVRGGL